MTERVDKCMREISHPDYENSILVHLCSSIIADDAIFVA